MREGIDGLIIIGGDGSFRGAQTFSSEHSIPCIGLPGTIDKDIAGTEVRIRIAMANPRESMLYSTGSFFLWNNMIEPMNPMNINNFIIFITISPIL